MGVGIVLIFVGLAVLLRTVRGDLADRILGGAPEIAADEEEKTPAGGSPGEQPLGVPLEDLGLLPEGAAPRLIVPPIPGTDFDDELDEFFRDLVMP